MRSDETPTCPDCRTHKVQTREIAIDLKQCTCEECGHEWSEPINDEDELD